MITSGEAVCTNCGEFCNVVPLDNAFDYSGTHCTNGNKGTCYPPDYGTLVSDCCEAEYTNINN